MSLWMMATTHADMFIIGHCLIHAFVIEGCVGCVLSSVCTLHISILNCVLSTLFAHRHTHTVLYIWSATKIQIAMRAWCFCSHGKPLAKIHPWIAPNKRLTDFVCAWCLVFSTSSVMQSLALDRILYRNCAAEVGLNTVGEEKMSCNQIARMSQEVSKRLGSVGYNPNESPIYN